MPTNRRRFLSAVSGAAAAPLFVPSTAFGANDRIRYAVLGVGSRGRSLNRTFTQLGAQCEAVCDVYEPNLQAALKDTPGAKTYRDYRELLESQDGIDLAVIASPDHHHYPMLGAAVEAGKDAYLEKPLSKTLEESAQIIRTVRASKQVVQVGMQRRSAPAIWKAKGLVEAGALGRMTLVKAQWHWNISAPLDNSPLAGEIDWARFLGAAPERPLEPMRFRRWRYFWDYAGGNMTDQGTHLMDVVQWFTRSGPPRSAVCQGYVAKMTGAEHPDVFCAVFEYPDLLASWTLDYANSYQNGWSITFMGDKGTMVLDEEGYRVYEEPWKSGAVPVHEEKAPVPLEPHVQNLLDCMRTRQDPNCTVEIAANAVAGPHLANLAMITGRQVKLQPGTFQAL